MPRPGYSSTSQGRHHPDFNVKWVQDILNEPDLHFETRPAIKYDDPRWEGRILNTMFNITLAHEDGIRAGLSFQRPCKEPDTLSKMEDCYLISIGTGLDGRPGRGHGGLTSLLMDQVLGTTATHYAKSPGDDPPATATMTVDYKAPVDTPGIILIRSWLTEQSGRKVWMKGVIEDGKGRLCASGKALFVHPRPKAAL